LERWNVILAVIETHLLVLGGVALPIPAWWPACHRYWNLDVAWGGTHWPLLLSSVPAGNCWDPEASFVLNRVYIEPWLWLFGQQQCPRPKWISYWAWAFAEFQEFGQYGIQFVLFPVEQHFLLLHRHLALFPMPAGQLYLGCHISDLPVPESDV